MRHRAFSYSCTDVYSSVKCDMSETTFTHHMGKEGRNPRCNFAKDHSFFTIFTSKQNMQWGKVVKDLFILFQNVVKDHDFISGENHLFSNYTQSMKKKYTLYSTNIDENWRTPCFLLLS